LLDTAALEKKATMPRKKQKVRLGERHARILKVMQRFQDEWGYTPTVREIGRAVGVPSTSLVYYYLNQLEETGYIDRQRRVSRGIRLLKPVSDSALRSVEALRVPKLGRIAAGAPLNIPATDFPLFDSESTVEVLTSHLPARDQTGPLYALEVQGDSMIDAMVNDGDIVIIKPTNQAQNGEMIAAWLYEKEATTLKFFYQEGRRVRLQPANPNYKPTYLDRPEEQLLIQGKVVMVLRQFPSLIA
jgi:repressor LexA